MKNPHPDNVSAYELMLVLLPNLGEEGTEKELDEIRKLITTTDGVIYNEDLWGTQELAYTIRKQDNGFYAVLNFKTAPANLKEIETALNINSVVLRFLITKTPSSYHIVTGQEYKEIAEQQAKEKAEAKAAKEEKSRPTHKQAERPERKPYVKKEVKEVKEEKVVEKKVVAEVVVEKPAKAVKKPNLEEADKRLKSIIDDPDITL